MSFSKNSLRPSRYSLFDWLRIGPADRVDPDEIDTSTGALWRTLRGDPWGLAMLAGLALVAASELIALAIDRPLPSRAGPLLQTIRMGLVVGAVRIGLTRVIHQEERRFWKEIGLAFALQLLAAAVLTVAGTGPLAVKVVIDGLFAFSYLALVIAVERPIRRRRGLHPADLGPSVEWSGGAVFVLGLLFYFSIISLLANRQAYESLLPSAYMVLVLDIYILVRLYYFGSHSEAPRWRMLYSLLMVAIFLVFANHLLTSLELSEAVAELPGTLVDFGWNIPFLALILAIRLRHHPFPSDESLFDSVNRRDRLPWPRERLVIFALAFPFIHLAFHTADLLDPTSKPVRESFALAWLMLFGALALVQQRMLEKRARTLWRERMQAEEALTKSHETLRLATERAQAEEAMRKSEEKFTKAFRSIPDSMLISTLADGRILEINESFRRHFGYEREAVVGRTGVELDLWVELEDRAMMTRLLRERGMVRNLELELKNCSGDRRQTLLSGEVIDLEGETCFLMVLRDISERKKAELKLREQAALLDKARDAIAVLDLDDQIIYWNKSAERLYGWTAEEILGRTASEELYPTSSEELRETQDQVLTRGEWVGELEQRTHSGETILVESRWTLVKNDRGEPISQLMINTDITDKRRLEERLKRAERLESIGTLASSMAHDLNHVLVPIRTTVQVLRQAPVADRYDEILARLEQNARHGLDVVRQILSLAGRVGESLSFEPRHLLEGLERHLNEELPAAIELDVRVPENPWTVEGDAGQIYEVLLHLAENAREAMEPIDTTETTETTDGEPPAQAVLTLETENVWMDRFYARRHAEAHEGPYVVVTVTDTGRGLSEEEIDRIFEPFFTTKDTSVAGTGLGLTTSRAIVASHGGFLTAYSEPGTGSSFQVYLPAVPISEGRETEEAPPELPAGHGEGILVVDDDASIRDIIGELLGAFGYRVFLARGGPEALMVYRDHHGEIDLILLDMMMPILDGEATLLELRKLDTAVRVIAVSGLATKERIEHDESVEDFLEKPYTAEKLLRTLRTVLPGGE